MDDCCEVREIPREQRRTLQIVLLINVVMFVTESVAGVLAHSTALFADSLDMLGDAVVYGFSLYVIGRGIELLLQFRFGVREFLKDLIQFNGHFLSPPARKVYGSGGGTVKIRLCKRRD